MATLNYKVSLKERIYFPIMAVLGLAIYCVLIRFFYFFEHNEQTLLMAYIYATYAAVLAVYIMLLPLFFKGSLIGNSVKLTEKQFPEYYEILVKQSALLGLKKVPESYIIQSGGILNAFATRILGRNYVVLFSGLLSKASEEGKEAVEFIIAHELGHIKRNHVSFFWNLLILPATFIPFLFKAYSRAREYTCDSIGNSLAPLGSEKGLIILSAGKDLVNHVNVEEFILNYNKEKGWSTWLSEIFSTHPLLIKRVIELRKS